MESNANLEPKTEPKTEPTADMNLDIIMNKFGLH